MRLPSAVCVAILSASAAHADPLPLDYGYYVADGTACSDASNATLQLVTPTEFNWPQQVCKVGAVVPGDPPAHAVTLDCEASADFPAERLNVTLTIPDRQTFGLSFQGEPPAVKHFCAQASLPDPWRSNAIGN